MPLQFTPTRAVLVLLVLAAGVLFVGVALFAEAERSRAQTLDGAELAAAASGLAAALEPGAAVEDVLDEVVRRENLAGAFFLDTVGRVLAQSAGRRLDGIDWGTAIVPAMGGGEARDLVRRSWQGEVYWMAASPTVDGRRVVLLRPAVPGRSAVGWALGVALGLWLLVAGTAVLVLRLSRRPADLLEALARDLNSSEDVTAMELVQKKFDTRPLLGDRAKPMFELASNLLVARRRAKDAETVAHAFLQIGPHYAVLCTMGGTVIDANPAFFARTGLMPEWLRGQPFGVLEDILPMAPLMELAERSKRENAAISGVPYELNVDGQRRAVDVALRAFPTSDGDTVLFLLSDRTKERTLEHQIDQYADALDLMVDQRVAELTAGRDDLDPLLEAAGAIVATFGREGETLRFNAEAERLTGRTAFTIRHLDDLAQALFSDAEIRDAFAAWFWGADHRSFHGTVRTPRGEFGVLWLRGERRQAGEAVEHLLLGVATAARPARFGRGGSPAAERVPADLGDEPGGDGYAFNEKRT